eukprot:264901-Chlamydomonas_euryale.AAC.1
MGKDGLLCGVSPAAKAYSTGQSAEHIPSPVVLGIGRGRLGKGLRPPFPMLWPPPFPKTPQYPRLYDATADPSPFCRTISSFPAPS